ncbi:MAG TPA: 6-carboxytetrahydropterin synthase [Planctomycetota bacterium]
MRTLHVTHRAEFCAAYRLASPALSDDENRRTYGVCFSPHGHGHNYLLEVTVAGAPDSVTGMVMDLNRLKALVEARVVQAVDHKNLNHDVDFLAGIVPTSENLLLAFWERLADELPGGVQLDSLRLQESRDQWVDYRGPASR